MTSASQLDPKLLELCEAFDRSFAEAEEAERPEQLDFLALRVAGDPYAMRLSEIKSLHVGRKLVTTPSALPALLGMAGFRGVLTPVYDLGRLLGYPAEPSPKWLVIARSAAPVAFAFAAFEAHLRVALDRLSAPELGASAAIRGAIRQDTGTLPLLHLPSLVEGIAQRIKTFGSSQER
ncbi:MAG TPA: chemotaxis protein CheW [Polyangiaceae bacterium]|jgi:purine-binding chemotaxis protein CheW|nr:chemotaxis protein CheW [Polyangiaceae bacterium]